MIENRRWPRVALQIPAQFAIVIPGHIHAPLLLESVVLDLSERGLLVEMNLPEAFYHELLKELRWCRINLSETDLPRQVIGKIVWIDRRSDGVDARCRLGVYLEDLQPDDAARLQQFVAAARAAAKNH